MEKSQVMVVEDEAIVAIDLDRIMRQAGHSVPAIVASGEEAIIRAKELQPDLVLMDIRLRGEMDGIEAASHIRSAGNVPIIFITAHEDDETMGRAAPLEPSGYILKPFSDREVQISVELALYRHKSEVERQHLSDQLARSQKMEAFGTLAGGIAHDFNNLLTTIMSYSELALIKSPVNDVTSNYLKEIQKSAERASKLTQQLLAFSRHQAIKPGVVDLNELILDIDSLLRRLIEANMELVTLPAAEPVTVKIDPGQMETVLVNLVVNARDALPDGGSIVISTAILAPGEAAKLPELTYAEYVLLSVSDNGTGMEKEVAARIFEPYFTTKEVGKGSGLGLSTCYGIVKQNNGSIAVESEPGKGTTFNIYLPRVQGIPDVLPMRHESGYLPTGNETVLIVEDEPSVRLVAAQILQNQGYEVLIASDGEEALRMARELTNQQIHLLLTDVVMPLMSGSQLAARFREIHPEAGILYTSGYNNDASVHPVVIDKGSLFLQKPFTPGVLARKVREVLDR